MLLNKKGIAMLVVVALVLMLLILGGSVLMVSSGHFGTSFHQMERARAYYAAEAAKQHTLWQLRTGDITPPYSGTFPNDINRISGSDITIEVLAENADGVHPINITVNY